jgi:hypothetical protein
MFKYLFEALPGIEIFATIALFLFIGLFIGILIWVIRIDKDYLKKMRHLPLESLKNDGD